MDKNAPGIEPEQNSPKVTFQPILGIEIPPGLRAAHDRYRDALIGKLKEAQDLGSARTKFLFPFSALGLLSFLPIYYSPLSYNKLIFAGTIALILVAASLVSSRLSTQIKSIQAKHPTHTPLRKIEAMTSIPRTDEESETIQDERLRGIAHLVEAIKEWNTALYKWLVFLKLVQEGFAIMRPSNKLAYEELIAERANLQRRLTKLVEPGERRTSAFRVTDNAPDDERAAIAEEHAEVEATAALIPSRMDLFHRYFS